MTKLGLGILLLATGCLATAADNPSYESALAKGNHLLEEEEYAEAAEVLDAAIESLRAGQGGDTLDTLHLLLAAATAQDRLNRAKPSNAHFNAAIEVLEKSSSEIESDLVDRTFSELVSASNFWGDRKRTKQLTAVYDVARKVLNDDDIRIASMATQLGFRVANNGRRKEATAILDQAYAVLIKSRFVDPDPIGSDLVSLAAAYVLVDRLETADELAEIAGAIGASTDGPTPIRRVAPYYPMNCLSVGIEGEVQVTMVVDESGRVSDLQVNEIRNWRGGNKKEVNDNSCRKEMEQAAVKAAIKFRYIPALEKGLPVVSEGIWTTIFFELEN